MIAQTARLTENDSAGDAGGGGGGDSSGGCSIATAAYGSQVEPHVKLLREFRDRYLLTNPIGRCFVDVYYTCSPPVADFIGKHAKFRAVVCLGLLPIVGVSWVAINLSPVRVLAFMLLLLALISATAVVLYRKIRLRAM